MKQLLVILFTLFLGLTQAKEYNKILLVNGYLHVGNGETVPTALIGIENGKISLIKNSLAYSYNKEDWDTIIQLNGQHIYPGFVTPNNTLGLTEIDAVRATRDFNETGELNPHVRTQIAFNTESDVVATVRTNGVLICQATPRGGIISGTSSVMHLDGWNWEDATISGNDGIHLNWPNAVQRSKENRSVKEKSDKYSDNKREIYDFFNASKAYAGDKDPEKIDLRYEAMRECFKGEKRVYIHADELQQLHDVIEFIKHFDIKYPVIVGGYDSHLIIPQLRDYKIPVMIGRPHSLPQNTDDPIDAPYKLAAKLQEGGVLYCIQNEGDMEAMNGRNLPFLAGTCQAYGLTEEQAVAAITLNACKIMGIDKNYGSIEVGKAATLFISIGNALDMRTNQVTLALINGNFMSLSNHQKDLYIKYKKKYQ